MITTTGRCRTCGGLRVDHDQTRWLCDCARCSKFTERQQNSRRHPFRQEVAA